MEIVNSKRLSKSLLASELSVSKSRTSTLMASCSFSSNFVAVHELSKLRSRSQLVGRDNNPAVFTEVFV